MTTSAYKKKKQGVFLTIFRVLLVLLSLCMLLVDIMMVCTLPERKAAVASIVVLDSPTLLPENEGKLVLVRGTYTVLKAAHDEDFGITFDAPLAVRIPESFNKRGRRSIRYDWEQIGEPVSLVGQVMLGELALDDPLLAMTPPTLVVSELGDPLPDGLYTVTEDGVAYVSFDDIREVKGTRLASEINAWRDYRRYSYELADPAATYTVVGIQKDGKLCLDEDMDDESVLLGLADPSDYLAAIRGEFWLTVSICTAILLVSSFFAFLGVLYLKPKKNTAASNTPKRRK